jgi:hypothetical protein
LYFGAAEPEEKGVNSSGADNVEELYLAPSLLHESNDNYLPAGNCGLYSFSFIFATKKYLKQKSVFTVSDCNKLGFLPSGLFEKLISKQSVGH